MSKMGAYNIDIWNLAFEVKSVAVKYGVDVTDVYNHMNYCIKSDGADE